MLKILTCVLKANILINMIKVISLKRVTSKTQKVPPQLYPPVRLFASNIKIQIYCVAGLLDLTILEVFR